MPSPSWLHQMFRVRHNIIRHNRTARLTSTAPLQSSASGTSSSKYFMSFTLISVLSSPLNTSEMNSACTCICICGEELAFGCFRDVQSRTISKEPLNTPHNTLLNHSPPSNASSGSSTNSARGFSSKVNVKDAPTDAWLVLGRPGEAVGGGGAV